MYLSVLFAYMCACRGQTKAPDSLNLELQAVVNCQWVLGSELRSLVRAASAIIHRAISWVPSSAILNVLINVHIV